MVKKGGLVSTELLQPEKVMIEVKNNASNDGLFDTNKKFNKNEKTKTLYDIRDELIRPQFNKNALEILQKRYLAKEEGEENETAQDLLIRVAWTIAETEKLYGATDQEILDIAKKFYETMARLEFFPNSPTLRGAGRRIHQLAACFVPEQPILSNPDLKPIAMITSGDKIISHTGHYQKVISTFKRFYNDNLYYIFVKGILGPTLQITPEHPVLSLKKQEVSCLRNRHLFCNPTTKKACFKLADFFKKDCPYLNEERATPSWRPIKTLEKGDWVEISWPKEIKDFRKIKISNFLKNDRYQEVKGWLFQKNNDKQNRSGYFSSQTKPVKNEILVDNDLMRVFGYYLSEGDSGGNFIRFTFAKKEEGYAKEVLKIFKKKFGVETKLEFSKRGNWLNLRFHSKILSDFFQKVLNTGFDQKDIPRWVMDLPSEKQFSLLVGLFRGDGCHHNRQKQDIIYLSLSNKQLAIKVWNILLRSGYNFNIKTEQPKKGKLNYRISAAPSECEKLARAVSKNIYSERKRFVQYLKIGKRFLRRITKIESRKYRGYVWNLEIANDNSYLANGVAVHNCFVIPIEDSMEGIFDALKTTALVHKGGGGTGFSFGRLRPSGDKVGSTGGVAGGPLSFMHIFDTMAHEVMQGGVRVGANMGILPVWHPDIKKWIQAKADGQSFLNFNLSVAATDEFMEKIDDNKEIDLINPRNKKICGTLRAGDTFDLIIQNAWKNGDPGIIFIDKINKDNPTPEIGEIESTNPCGEQPLLPHESCNLGSINLAQMTKNGQVDWEKLKKTTHTAVRFMDNVIDANRYFVPEIEKMTKGNRKIGLGVMGFADMLAGLGIPYDSEEGIKLAEKIMKFIQEEGIKESEALAISRGPFPNIYKSIFKNKTPRRNATITTIAPTGTLSLLGGSAGGIEPFFAIVIRKKSIWRQDGTAELEQIYTNPIFEQIAKKEGWYSQPLMEKISAESSIQNFEEIPQNVRKVFVTAHDISPEWHIKMQAAFQKYTDNAVSKTINFPNSATIDNIKKAYLLAYKLGCKGLTVYRDGSRETQVLTTGKDKKDEEGPEKLVATAATKIVPRERPDIIHGFTYRIKTAYGKLFVTINDDENGQAFEIFSHLGKAGGFFAAKAEAICRLMSLSLRSGIDPEEIISQLKGIRGPTPTWSEEGKMILSLPDAIAKVLEKHINREQAKLDLAYETAEQPKLDQGELTATDKTVAQNNLSMANGFSPKPKVASIADYGDAPACPECGAVLELGEGCLKCNFCGYSKCS